MIEPTPEDLRVAEEMLLAAVTAQISFPVDIPKHGLKREAVKAAALVIARAMQPDGDAVERFNARLSQMKITTGLRQECLERATYIDAMRDEGMSEIMLQARDTLYRAADALAALSAAPAATPRLKPHCETCGKDVDEVLCPTCTKWWADNNPAATPSVVEAETAETIRHAESDLRHADGLEAHLDSDGTVAEINMRDLIAMVRWNADHLIATLRAAEPAPAPDKATMERIVAEAAIAERERCAKIAETQYAGRGWHPIKRMTGLNIAELIRATAIEAGEPFEGRDG